MGQIEILDAEQISAADLLAVMIFANELLVERQKGMSPGAIS